MKGMHSISFWLLVIGGINWGLVGLGSWLGGNWNVVNLILGSWPAVENLVSVLVGLSALQILFTHKRDCRMCNMAGSSPAM
jgi:uncharacterized membrane protein YuzA (DUF378 family)